VRAMLDRGVSEDGAARVLGWPNVAPRHGCSPSMCTPPELADALGRSLLEHANGTPMARSRLDASERAARAAAPRGLVYRRRGDGSERSRSSPRCSSARITPRSSMAIQAPQSGPHDADAGLQRGEGRLPRRESPTPIAASLVQEEALLGRGPIAHHHRRGARRRSRLGQLQACDVGEHVPGLAEREARRGILKIAYVPATPRRVGCRRALRRTSRNNDRSGSDPHAPRRRSGRRDRRDRSARVPVTGVLVADGVLVVNGVPVVTTCRRASP
jgi:hypothetical protein